MGDLTPAGTILWAMDERVDGAEDNGGLVLECYGQRCMGLYLSLSRSIAERQCVQSLLSASRCVSRRDFWRAFKR